MKLTKNGKFIELKDKIQINAFKHSGWTEVKEPDNKNGAKKDKP